MNMLAMRCDDLHLDRCHIGPSELPDAGSGLFASRDIRAGELITLYPGDALLYWKHGRQAPSSRVCSGVIFGAHIPDDQKDAARVTTESARKYEVGASSTLSCVGDPRRDDNPAYLGHFANDGSVCSSAAYIDVYREATRVAANADHVTLEGCQLATQATRAIASGEEIFVSYGEGYWLSHLLGIDDVPDQVMEFRQQRSAEDLGPTNAPPTMKESGGDPGVSKKSKRKGRAVGRAVGMAGSQAGRKSGGVGFGRAVPMEGTVAPPPATHKPPSSFSMAGWSLFMGSPASSAHAASFTLDVSIATGLCFDGRVRIGPSPGKGLGAFAVHALSPLITSGGEALVRGEHQIGEYRGEVYTIEELQMRYGRGGVIAAADAVWHEKWSRERQAR